MTTAERNQLIQAIQGLMVAENMGDVHDYLNLLHDLAGLPRPEGDYLSGWTETDWAHLETPGGTDDHTG